MDFDIQPNDLGENGPRSISIPDSIRENLGVLIGQFIQLEGKEQLVLEVAGPVHGNQEVAYVDHKNFGRVQGQSLEFEILDVTLGCDPEFFMVWGRRKVSASSYLPFEGQVGSDGELGELRPMYAKHEGGVVSNLRKLIHSIPGSLHRDRWLKGFPLDGSQFTYEAHSYHFHTAAGFHVHLGIPPEILNTRKEYSRHAMNHLVRCLDWYVSIPLMPLETNHARRLGSTNYGQPGDYRCKNLTLEYRTPGAFYLRSPIMTAGLLGMSLMVTETIVSRIKITSKGFTSLDKLSDKDLQEILPIPKPEVVLQILRGKDTNESKKHVSSIYDTMLTLPSYNSHRESIERFFRAVETQEIPEANLLRNWKGSL